MNRTIEIKLNAQPQMADTFTINVNFEGVAAPFAINGLYYTWDDQIEPFDNGIIVGATIADTIIHTNYQLNTLYPHQYIAYAITGNTILVGISSPGNIAVTYSANAGNRITLRDVTTQAGFEGGVDTTLLRKAYNNDIITFGADPAAEPLFATVAAPGMSLRLFPEPSGKFSINLKPYVSALINTSYFEDRLVPQIDAALPSSYLYRSNDGHYLEADVTFKITTSSGDVQEIYNLAWFAGAEQPGYANRFVRSGLYIFTPFSAATANTYHVKYWQGYPFDFMIYCPTSYLKLKNTGNLLSQAFDLDERVSRVVLSDGRTDETLENLLPLATGTNTIRIMPQAQELETDKFLVLDKISYCKGVYLKWFNKYGGYSYWLFEDTYTIDRSTKQLGELERDFTNVDAMQSRSVQIGKTSQDSMRIVAEMLQPHERDVVEGLLDSPKIYLFTGAPFSRADARSWIEVTLKTTSARLKNARQPLTSFSFDIELPERYTQTL